MAFDAGSIEASMTLDRDPFQRGLDAARKEAQDFARRNGIEIKLDLDHTQFDRDLTDVQRRAVQASRNSINIAVDAQTAAFNRKYTDIQAKVKAADGYHVDIGWDLNDALANTKFAAWRAKIAQMNGSNINVDVDVNTAGATAHLRAFEATSRASGQRAGRGGILATAAGLLSGVGRMAAAGVTSAASFSSRFVSQTGQLLSSTGQYIMPILIGSLVGVMPIIGAFAAASLVSAFGLGLAGLGIIVAAHTKGVKKAFKDAFDYVKRQMKTLASPFEGELKKMAAMIKPAFDVMAPSLGASFSILAPAIHDFFGYLLQAVTKLAPAMQPIANAFSQLLAAFGPALPGIFQQISNALIQIANTIMQNPNMFAGMLINLVKIIPVALRFINWLAQVALWINSHQGIVTFFFHLLTPITALSSMMHAVGQALGWLGGVFKTVGRGIQVSWNAVWGFVRSVPGAVLNGVRNVVNNVFHGITAAFQWVNKTARAIWNSFWGAIRNLVRVTLNAARAFINLSFRGFIAAFNWVRNGVYKIWNAIWTWVRNLVRSTMNTARAWLNAAFRGFVAAYNWVRGQVYRIWNAIWTWVKNLVRSAMNVARNFLNTAFRGFVSAFGWVRTQVTGVWNKLWGWIHDKARGMLNTIRGVIDRAMRGFRDAFAWARDEIGKVWRGIQSVTAKPVNFVIGTVYNKGIAWFFNKVMGFLGIKGHNLKALPGIPGYASGGILPGYSPGKDNMLAASPMGPVALAGGEAIMRPEWTKAAGPAYVNAANAAARKGQASSFIASNGVPGFAAGGIFDTIGSAVKGSLGAIGDLASSGWGKVKDVTNWIMDHSVKALWDRVGGGVVNKSISALTQQAGGWGSTLAQVPKKILSEALKYLQNQADMMGGSGQAADVIRVANKYIGTHESPMGSNRQIFGQRFGMNGVAWCAEFITEVFKEAGAGKAIPHSAAVAAFNGSNLKRRRGNPVPGDLFTYGNSHINLYTGPGHRTVGGNQSDAVTADTSHYGRRSATLIPNYAKGGAGSTDLAGRSYYAFAKDQMRQMGMSVPYNWSSLYNLWMGESHWNPHARNPSSGAGGIPQALPASKMGAGWYSNPGQQIGWGLRYIRDRYGNPFNAYHAWLSRSPHWYDAGGDLRPGGTVAWNGTGKTESVVTAPWREQQERVLSKLEAQLENGQQPLVGTYQTVYQDVGQTREAMRDLNFQLRKWQMEAR